MNSLIGKMVKSGQHDWLVTDQPENDPGLIRIEHPQFKYQGRWVRVKDVDILPE